MRTVCRAWGSFPAALRSAGFSGRRRRRSSDRNAEIVERWNAGEPEWYIAAEMRLSGNQVRYEVDAARRRGEDVGLHRKRNREDWPEIERLYHEGLTYREIGERIGGSVDVVAVAVKKMRRAGYDLPRRR